MKSGRYESKFLANLHGSFFLFSFFFRKEQKNAKLQSRYTNGYGCKICYQKHFPRKPSYLRMASLPALAWSHAILAQVTWVNIATHMNQPIVFQVVKQNLAQSMSDPRVEISGVLLMVRRSSATSRGTTYWFQFFPVSGHFVYAYTSFQLQLRKEFPTETRNNTCQNKTSHTSFCLRLFKAETLTSWESLIPSTLAFFLSAINASETVSGAQHYRLTVPLRP